MNNHLKNTPEKELQRLRQENLDLERENARLNGECNRLKDAIMYAAYGLCRESYYPQEVKNMFAKDLIWAFRTMIEEILEILHYRKKKIRELEEKVQSLANANYRNEQKWYSERICLEREIHSLKKDGAVKRIKRMLSNLYGKKKLTGGYHV
ncbi:MAG: hypothetical protein NC048_09870 [Bacteroides sp.]|nr:hypothetical protein [Bacteroides sp.]